MIKTTTDIESVINFVRSEYDSHLEEFLLAACKGLVTVPLDAFGKLKYTNAHVALARIHYLEDKERHDLIRYGILWDIAKLFSYHSLLSVSRQDAFSQLIEIFKIPHPNQAEITPLLSFDSSYPNYSKIALEYLRKSTELGYYYMTFTSVYTVFRKYLTQ